MLRRHVAIAGVVLLLALASCGGDDDASAVSEESSSDTAESTTSTEPDATTTTSAPVLTVLVTNDDGIGAPGIDTIVNALAAMDGVEVVVVAPAENQSGSSDSTTEGGVSSSDGETASGVAGTAVDGFPADAVLTALDDLGVEPDLVVSGVNEGQNIGPFAELSGTLGAARTAIRRDVPAVAASAGLGENADFAAATDLVVAWIEENRDAILDGSASTDTVVSFNVPGCTAGEIGDLVEVPIGASIPEGVNVFESDCSIADGATPTDDVGAIIAGYATRSLVPADL